MQLALVLDGRVVEIRATGQDFPVAEAMSWVEAPDTVAPGWTYDGTSFVAPAEQLPANIRLDLSDFIDQVLTEAEHDALNTAAQGNAAAQRFKDRLLAHQWVELGSVVTPEQQRTVAFLDAADALGIFAMHADTAARKWQILSWRPA